MNLGVYSDDSIRSFIDEGVIILGDDANIDSQVQPSSFDLTVGSHFFCLPFSSIPPGSEKLESYFKRIANYEFDALGKEGAFLHKGNVYVVKLQESLSLPDFIEAKANPKSSIGRIDLHVRLITEDGVSFDSVPAGYNGELWLELYSRSFDLKIHKGECLNQIRFLDPTCSALTKDELVCLHRDCGLVYNLDNEKSENSLGISSVFMRVSVPHGLVGYVAREDAPMLDLSRRDLPLSLFFDKVHSGNNGVIINPNSFYIFNSKGIINIPTSVCSEMIDIDTGVGEFRGHYAGFFDPGFCAQAVLEVRNYGQPFLLVDNQIVSGLKYFRMKTVPRIEYGHEFKGSHYQGQKGARFAKFFKNDFES